jgi:hypothetical protein
MGGEDFIAFQHLIQPVEIELHLLGLVDLHGERREIVAHHRLIHIHGVGPFDPWINADDH